MRYCEKKRILLCNVLLRQKVWSFGGATSYFRSHGHIGPEIAARSTRLTIRVQWRSRLMRTASRRWPGQLPRAEARRLVRTAVSQAPSLGRHCPKKCIWRGARDENISDSPCEPCRRTSSSLLPFSFKAGPDKSLPEHRSLPSPGISPHEAFKNFTRPHTVLGTIVRSLLLFSSRSRKPNVILSPELD